MDAKIHFDRDLVARVLGGEVEAQFEFYALVNTYISRICIKCRSLDRETTKDVCQEICLSLYRNLPRIENLEQWLSGAIRRRFGDLVRPVKNSQCEALPERTPSSPEQSVALWDALRRLSALCKRIIFFHYIHGYSQRSIARSEGLSEGTLPLRKKECLDKLFILYHGECHEK
jgi:RNA polymerase sigma factor (sigma-70 family)